MSGVTVHVVPCLLLARAPLRAWRRSAPGAATRYQHRVDADG